MNLHIPKTSPIKTEQINIKIIPFKGNKTDKDKRIFISAAPNARNAKIGSKIRKVKVICKMPLPTPVYPS